MQNDVNKTFETAFQMLMLREGGAVFTNDSSDPGGATKFGVTLKTLRNYRNDQTLGAGAVETLSEDEAKEICFNLYYQPLDLDVSISSALSIIILDQAFNRGVETVRAELNARLSPAFPTLPELILYACHNEDYKKKFCLDFIIGSQRAYFQIVQKNPNLLKFLHGWILRTHSLLRLILSERVSTD